MTSPSAPFDRHAEVAQLLARIGVLLEVLERVVKDGDSGGGT